MATDTDRRISCTFVPVMSQTHWTALVTMRSDRIQTSNAGNEWRTQKWSPIRLLETSSLWNRLVVPKSWKRNSVPPSGYPGKPVSSLRVPDRYKVSTLFSLTDSKVIFLHGWGYRVVIFLVLGLSNIFVSFMNVILKHKKNSQLAGFEPALPEGIWFQVRRLNHSATTARFIRTSYTYWIKGRLTWKAILLEIIRVTASNAIPSTSATVQ